MKCPKCNTELPDNSRFCLSCGAPLTVDAAEGSAAVSPPAQSTGSKLLFYAVVAVLAVSAIVAGIAGGKYLAAVQNAANLAAVETIPTPVPTSVPTPEPTPEPTPVPTPAPEPAPPVYADEATLLAQFREIRGTIRSQAVAYVNGPLVLIPQLERNSVYERIVSAVSALGYVSECSAETQDLYISTQSGLQIVLGTDGHISLINCPAGLAGNALNENISTRAAISGSELSSDPQFAESLQSILEGSVGLYSYSAPNEELFMPPGSTKQLSSLCYFIVESTGNLYSGSGNVVYSSAVYNTLWGEAPLSLDGTDSAHSGPVLHQSGRVAGSQMYTAFSNCGVMPGAMLVSAPSYGGGDTFISTAILLGYDGSSVDVLYVKDGLVQVLRTDWANFSYIFGPDSYLQSVYQPDRSYIRSRFPNLKKPAFNSNAGAFNPDPDTLDAPKLSIYGHSVPYSINEGGSFGIYGNISTDAGEIVSVTVTVTDSYGNVWQTHTVYPEAGTKLININGGFNTAIRFGGLTRGSYRYTVSATARSGYIEVTDTLINQGFTVG